MASLNVPMTDELRRYVDERAASGAFSTPSEYVRHLIREDRERENDRRLEALLLEGLSSGPATNMTSADWRDVRETLRETLARRRGHGSKKKTSTR